MRKALLNTDKTSLFYFNSIMDIFMLYYSEADLFYSLNSPKFS